MAVNPLLLTGLVGGVLAGADLSHLGPRFDDLAPLDEAACETLAKTGVVFHAPLGVGVHLEAWGVPAATRLASCSPSCCFRGRTCDTPLSSRTSTEASRVAVPTIRTPSAMPRTVDATLVLRASLEVVAAPVLVTIP